MIDIAALGQCIDTSFGRSSTPLSASHSIKMTLVGDGRMKVSYIAIVNFRSNSEFMKIKASHADEATRLVLATLKNVKETYKSITGETLKIESLGSDDSVEVIGLGVYNPKRTAYYRRIEMFEVG